MIKNKPHAPCWARGNENRETCPLRKHGGKQQLRQHATAALIYCRHRCKRGINEATLYSCLKTNVKMTLASHATDKLRLRGWCPQSPNRDWENNETVCSRSLRVHHPFSVDNRHKRSIVAFRLEQLIFVFPGKTQSQHFHIHSDCQRRRILLIPPAPLLMPPSKRPHNASVLLPTKVTNRLTAIQLSGGNHGVSVLTERKYYQPIWVSFHKYTTGRFPLQL